jgi:glutamyl-tRNA reductase
MSFDLKKTMTLVATVAALAMAGCGGDEEGDSSGEPLSEEDYAAEIQDVLTTFGEESTNLGADLAGSSSPEDLEAGVGSLDDVTQTAVDDLNAIEPPEAAAEAHETLTSALEGYLEDIQTLLSELDGASPEETQQAALDFQESATEVQTNLGEAAQQLQESGIEAPAP